jgi:predicted metal-dependent hydrolase
MRASWRDIEAFLRAKERWILAKLDRWAQLPKPRLLAGASGESLPYLGVEHTLDVREGRGAVSQTSARAGATITVYAPRSRALAALLAWLKAKALETLAPRVGRYAAALALPAPRVALSGGRRQWGTCSAAGTIRLNWRLVHVAPELADYVAAHEVAHLVEMNHSKRFWGLLAALYPAWRVARERLELTGATLPIIRRTP